MIPRKFARQVFLLMSPLCLSACVFILCYNLDNKYTKTTPPIQNGVVMLDEWTFAQTPFVHLTYGWALYRDVLLSPEDFPNQLPYEEIFIGQYPGFEADSASRKHHGSASYRLRLELPPETQSYMLELPEVFSAFVLYVNGEPLKQLGEPDPEQYRPLTKLTSVTFRAGGSLDILLAVTDHSGFYSGLTYPPAFGTPDAVTRLLTNRFALRMIVCVLAIALGLFYLITGLLSRRNCKSVLFGLMCFCFTGSVCYPVAKTLFAVGPIWSGIENFCFCAMLLLIALIGGNITGAPRKAVIGAAVCGGAVCAVSALSPLIATSALSLLYAYSTLMDVYTWALALFLTAFALRGVGRTGVHSGLILQGIVVFDCALIMDRLLPRFEPISFGWFAEIAGAFLVGCFAVVLTRETVLQAREKLRLETHIEHMFGLLDMQRRYYPVLLAQIDDARAARHDLRHHMRLIREFAAAGHLSELTDYLTEYKADAERETTLSYTQHYVTDTLLRHFVTLAEEKQIRFEVKADLPEAFGVPDTELAILLSNLMENALEACAGVPAEERFIAVAIRLWQKDLYILVRNSFDGHIRKSEGRLLSRKGNSREGIGLTSVRATALRLGGMAVFGSENNVFTAKVSVRAFSSPEEKTQEKTYADRHL